MPDVTAEEVRSLARRINANLEDFNDQTFPITRFATVALRHDRLQLLGDQDAVAWIESVGPYPIPDNAQTILPETKANVAHATPYNMDGAGIAVGVWEAFSFQAPPVFNTAAVLTTHLELAGRATPGDTVQDVMPSNHATHVAGTIASSGANLPVTKGVAPAAVITSWDAQNDCTEMTMAALAAPIGGMIIPIQVSNHSYGQQVGWANGVFGSQAPFGIYNNSASCFDSVATGTGLVIVKSAGNDRDDPAPGLATAAQPADCFTSFAPLAGDCITPGSTAKNVITVGAMDGGDQIAAFSNFGPTDDGRIKPDVVAPGDQSVGMQSIVSLGNAGVRATARFQGTSMAAPAVSGVAALAIQNARALAIPVQSASIKSLLVHTANDVKGTGQATPGPDFATGWGMVDAVAALSYLRRSSLGIPSSTPSATTALAAGIQSGTLLQTGNAGAVTFQFMVRNTAELKVTLGWDDPQPMMLAPPILVNDLDLTLTDPTGQSFEPWMLDPSRPGLAAVQNGGQDQINNIVQVSVPNPSCGVWTATVSSPSGATNLMNGPMMAPSQQNFALMLPTFPRSSFQIDFDGNGRSDIFRANGSEWRFSADGVQGWQHLNVSGIDSQLKFGHFDCDGLTDVFHSHGGKFNVSFGGRTGWTAINNSGVTSGLRLGDFDGDGIADVFRADGSQWWVSLGGSTGWTPLAQSSFESHELRFGDFEGDGITDVFRGDGEDWKVSFGGVGAWTTINVSQFETDEVAFGDFDGDGITDVFRADGEHWWISFSGTGSWQRMAQSETSLPDLEFADFDGDGTTDVFRGNGERWFFSRSAIGPWTGLARSQLEARDVSTR